MSDPNVSTAPEVPEPPRHPTGSGDAQEALSAVPQQPSPISKVAEVQTQTAVGGQADTPQAPIAPGVNADAATAEPESAISPISDNTQPIEEEREIVDVDPAGPKVGHFKAVPQPTSFFLVILALGLLAALIAVAYSNYLISYEIRAFRKVYHRRMLRLPSAKRNQNKTLPVTRGTDRPSSDGKGGRTKKEIEPLAPSEIPSFFNIPVYYGDDHQGSSFIDALNQAVVDLNLKDKIAFYAMRSFCGGTSDQKSPVGIYMFFSAGRYSEVNKEKKIAQNLAKCDFEFLYPVAVTLLNSGDKESLVSIPSPEGETMLLEHKQKWPLIHSESSRFAHITYYKSGECCEYERNSLAFHQIVNQTFETASILARKEKEV